MVGSKTDTVSQVRAIDGPQDKSKRAPLLYSLRAQLLHTVGDLGAAIADTYDHKTTVWMTT